MTKSFAFELCFNPSSKNYIPTNKHHSEIVNLRTAVDQKHGLYLGPLDGLKEPTVTANNVSGGTESDNCYRRIRCIEQLLPSS